MIFLDAKFTHIHLYNKNKNRLVNISQLPITEVHGVHPQLEVQLLSLVKPIKTKYKTLNKNKEIKRNTGFPRYPNVGHP